MKSAITSVSCNFFGYFSMNVKMLTMIIRKGVAKHFEFCKIALLPNESQPS